jgi:NADPH-dependent glutamate synthase beta subunit-like oxidoreductase
LVLCLRAAVETIECQAEVEEILVVIEEIEVEADEEDSVEEAAVEEVVEEEDAVALGAAEDEVAPGVEVVVEAEVIVEVTVLTTRSESHTGQKTDRRKRRTKRCKFPAKRCLTLGTIA